MSGIHLFRFLVMITGALLLLSQQAVAQGERGAITGTITDQSGAVIPGVEITVTNVSTAVKYEALSTSAGTYRVSALPPAVYSVSATKSGFKRGLADNIRVAVAATVNIDLRMELGEAVEIINVTAEAPLLQATAQVGTDVNPTEFNTWPIFVDDNQRQPQSFIFNSLPGTTGSSFEGSINGGQYYSHEILIDGITIGRNDLSGGSTEFTPSTEQVSEFQLQTNAGAQYGGAGSAVANFSIKSGTNQLHGTAYIFNGNSALSSKGASDNFFDAEKVFTNENNFGAAVSGPIRKDRTFFFGTYEGDRRRNAGNNGQRSIMTNAMRAGDFSEILTTQQVGSDALGRPIFRGQIFDPTTSRTVNGQLVRDAFPGNIIPQNRFSTVSKNALPQIPVPELPGQRNNIFRKQRPFSDLDLFGVKIDHVINSAHKINTYFNYNKRPRTNNFHLGSDFTLAANPLQLQTVNGRMVRIAEDWAIGARKVNSFRFGFNRVGNDNNSFYVYEGWPTKIGLKGVPDTHFPILDFNANYGITLQQLGRGTCGFGANGSWVLKDDFTWLRGKHTFQMGGEFRRYYYNQRECGNESGRFNFTLNSTRHPQFANTGHSVASFILGASNTATRDVYAGQPAFITNYPGFYFQDEIKITPTITLTAGIRWEIPRPRYEKHNFTSGFDPNEPNPGADGFRGALVFLEDKGLTSFQKNYYREFAPSLGVAWAITPKTVLRGGYSLTYSPPIANDFGFPEVNGQTATINLSRSRAPNAFDPVLYWDNGFPSLGVQLPVKDPTLNNDGDISYTEPGSLKQPYYQHFNLSLQRELPWHTSIELGYVGTKGTRLPLGTLRNYFNMLDSRFLSLGDTLLDDISDHPEIRKPYPSFEGTVQQALRPFPQYQGISITGYNQGNSTFHSGQLQIRKRPTKGGLGYIVAYTFSKTLTDSLSNIGGYVGYNFQDFYNRRSERALASFSSPHDLKITTIWEIPVGKGRHFLNKGGVTDKVLGGWTITAIQNYRSGDALAFTDSSLDPGIGAIFGEGLRPDRVTGVDPYVKSSGYDIANGSTWVNPSAFAHVPSTAGGVPRRLGNAPRFAEIYGPWTPSETVGFLKKIPITETVDFEMRADVTNVFNRTFRNNPDTDLASDSFGRILSVFGRRTWQMSGRIRF